MRTGSDQRSPQAWWTPAAWLAAAAMFTPSTHTFSACLHSHCLSFSLPVFLPPPQGCLSVSSCLSPIVSLYIHLFISIFSVHSFINVCGCLSLSACLFVTLSVCLSLLPPVSLPVWVSCVPGEWMSVGSGEWGLRWGCSGNSALAEAAINSSSEGFSSDPWGRKWLCHHWLEYVQRSELKERTLLWLSTWWELHGSPLLKPCVSSFRPHWPLLAAAAAGWACPSLLGWTEACEAAPPELLPERPSPSSICPSAAPSPPAGQTKNPGRDAEQRGKRGYLFSELDAGDPEYIFTFHSSWCKEFTVVFWIITNRKI